MRGLCLKHFNTCAVVVGAIQVGVLATLNLVEIFRMAGGDLLNFDNVVIKACQMSGNQIEAAGDAVIALARPFGLLSYPLVGLG